MPNALNAPLQSPHTPPQPPQNPAPVAGGSLMGGSGGMAPQGAPAAPSGMGNTPSRETVEQAHKHVNVVVKGLLELVNTPAGKLTKQDVFDSAADMIAKGAFPDQGSKQQLVAEMAKMPDDEQGLRKALGSLLLGAATAQTKLHAHFGPPEGQNGA